MSTPEAGLACPGQAQPPAEELGCASLGAANGAAANQGRQRTFLPQQNAGYLDAQYWDTRFQQEEEYDWFKGYREFRHLIAPHLDPSSRILVLGCGNSSLSLDLCRDGFTRITSIDLSPSVITRMRMRAAAEGMGQLAWQVADMLKLPFDSASFDVVVEKGTMDVLFVDNDSPWCPRPEVCARVARMLGETHRVLKENGVFLSVTFAAPHFRRPFLMAAGYTWDMEVATFGEGFHYYVYALRKGQRKHCDAAESAGQPARDAVCSIGLEESPMHEHMDNEDYLLRMSI